MQPSDGTTGGCGLRSPWRSVDQVRRQHAPRHQPLPQRGMNHPVGHELPQRRVRQVLQLAPATGPEMPARRRDIVRPAHNPPPGLDHVVDEATDHGDHAADELREIERHAIEIRDRPARLRRTHRPRMTDL